jgi:very-short-patch-repair endonuclease
MTRTQQSSTLADLVTREPRPFTFAALADCASERTARTAIERGQVVRLFHDTYVAAVHSESFAARARAAIQWLGPPAALGGASALFAFQLVDEAPDLIDLVVPNFTSRDTPPWLRLTRASYDYPVAWWEECAVTMPGFALAQAFGRVPRSRRSALVFDALRSRALTEAEVWIALDAMPRVRARRELVGRLASASAGAESHLEHVSLTTVFNTSEFAGLLRQHAIRTDAQRHRLDMYDPETRTAVERDGASFHSRVDQRERDLRRDAALASIGILTVRLSYRDIVGRPDWCRATVREVLRARRKVT